MKFDEAAVRSAPLPGLRFVLDDLTAQGEERVRNRSMPAAAMLAVLSLLGFPRRDALAVLRQLAELFAALPPGRPWGETLAAVVGYVLEVAEPEPDPEELRRYFDSEIGPAAAEIVMSAAGKLRTS